MTLANQITLIRMAMIPFFMVAMMQDKDVFWQAVALVLFCIASFTDFLDGYIARKYNQITDFGKFVDPLADKLLVMAALLLFIERGMMPAWQVAIILAREMMVTSLRVVASNKGRVMAASWTGKVKTCVQIGGVIVLFLLWFVEHMGMNVALWQTLVPWGITLITLYSGWDYLAKNWDIIKQGASKNP